MAAARIGIVGLGTMGRAHLNALLRTPDATAVAVADPAYEAGLHAVSLGVKHYSHYADMLEREALDGVLVAVPNAQHHVVGMACIERDMAVLIEKPIAESNESAQGLCDAAACRGVPVLVGHHRRHNPAVQLVRKAVAGGLIGAPTVANILDIKLKPDSYFATAWRTQPPAGGPVLLNMIHEIDVLRYVFGEIASLHAFSSKKTRGHDVEDTASVMLRFENGAIGTMLVSDCAATPFSWDLASGEFDLITGMSGRMERQDVPTHVFGGTRGAVTLPSAHYFSYRGSGEPGWRTDLSQQSLGADRIDTYLAQMQHFAKVALRLEPPLSSGLDAAKTLRATLAVKESAESGEAVTL